MKLKSLVLAAMVAGATVPTISLADPLPNGPHITTSGNAIVKAAPDMATLNILCGSYCKRCSSGKSWGR
ncbi:oxidative stress defense protein [Providencia rettgeri]|uniref:Oxidative stress defense protein n=1 Tax=Providencia rettgeri TaxID=587 RepID=A0A379FQ72_PRORE|nr:oxidative stress defense protein [Providencia rettgeri]